MNHEDGSFAGKVAFVTGAASGIGRATALAFARATPTAKLRGWSRNPAAGRLP